MKKKRIAIISSVIVVLTLGIIILVMLLSGNSLALVNRGKVKKIVVVNGNTGNITTIEENKTSDILDKLYGVSGERKEVSASTGWQYSITLYDDTSVLESIEMVSKDQWKKDGNYYSVKNGEAVIEALVRCEE